MVKDSNKESVRRERAQRKVSTRQIMEGLS